MSKGIGFINRKAIKAAIRLNAPAVGVDIYIGESKPILLDDICYSDFMKWYLDDHGSDKFIIRESEGNEVNNE